MSTKILWTGEVLASVMASKLPFSYVIGEVIELKDEVVKLDFTEARKEWDDVVGCFLVWLTGVTGVSFPLLPFLGKGAADRWIARRVVWARIFDLHGVAFHRRYLTGGGNYCKRSKVKKAFSAAGYGGFVPEFGPVEICETGEIFSTVTWREEKIHWDLLDFIDFEEE